MVHHFGAAKVQLLKSMHTNHTAIILQATFDLRIHNSCQAKLQTCSKIEAILKDTFKFITAMGSVTSAVS